MAKTNKKEATTSTSPSIDEAYLIRQFDMAVDGLLTMAKNSINTELADKIRKISDSKDDAEESVNGLHALAKGGIALMLIGMIVARIT